MASDSEDEGIEYMLGFVEKPERPHKLLAHHFPSKLGGQPVRAPAVPPPAPGPRLHPNAAPNAAHARPPREQAWLNPEDLPSDEQLACPVTGKPMQFLLQARGAPLCSPASAPPWASKAAAASPARHARASRPEPPRPP